MSGPRRGAGRGEAPRRRAAPFRCRLVIMAKAPVAGAVKTRLAREVGVTQATRFARAATAALLARVGADPRWQTVVAVAPDTAAASRCWPRGLPRMRQGRGDLGQRMQRIFDSLPPGPALIVGTDVPGIAPAHIARAFRLLGAHDAVFGPAADGGYWLVGLKRRPRRLSIFADVRWSSPHALADTLGNLRGRTVAFAATLSDVDDAPALVRNAARLGRRIPHPPSPRIKSRIRIKSGAGSNPSPQGPPQGGGE
jgi:rSAM/selenodomain-associated transferase 1